MSEFLMGHGPWFLAASIVAIVVGRLVFGTCKIIREHRRMGARLARAYEHERHLERMRGYR